MSVAVIKTLSRDRINVGTSRVPLVLVIGPYIGLEDYSSTYNKQVHHEEMDDGSNATYVAAMAKHTHQLNSRQS